MSALLAQLRALGRGRLIALAALASALLAGLALLALRAGSPPMGLLYADLDARDAGAIVQSLERARIPYRLAGGGAQVLVPVEEVARARVMLAREGLPTGGSIGNELFDRGDSLTTTPFQQEINRLRALEGELARTIRGIQGVRQARVHLVLPRREPFSRERGEAQASVVLTMQGAQRLDREGVQAVLHLVAAAVPGLSPRNISIIDSRGEVLARGGQAVGGIAALATAEELRRSHELRISRAVEELLERSLGPGRVRAEATVELDLDRVETREERFDPDNQVARSTHAVTETSRSIEPQNVSVANNLPGAEAAANGAGTQESRQEETTNFEIGRTMRATLREHPVIRRVSIAVLVDGVLETPPDGPPRMRERTPEELARIAALVRSAIGFNEQRGDRVEVVSMPFVAPAGEAPAGGVLGLDLPQPLLARLIETAILALVALAAILLIGRPLARRLALAIAPPALPDKAGQGKRDALPSEEKAAVASGAGTAALPQAEEAMVTMAHVEGAMRASSLAKLAELVKAQPEETLMVIRRWLTPPEDAA
ncbi:MAG: flagellar basal-body MS-ring/collar protein FliF [Rhodovarius sp.]|nr:flagellar basal-body MS-ring/collar protein FliF [Rhodovarius sp.]